MATSLRTLSITELHWSLLQDLLSCTPNLTTFEWEWSLGYLDKQPSFKHNIDLDVLATALQLIQSTLETLTLHGAFTILLKPGRIIGSLDRLYEFPKLHTLTAPIAFLGSIDSDSWSSSLVRSIPGIVRNVTINNDMYEWRDQIEDEIWEYEDIGEQLPEEKLLYAVESLLKRAKLTHPVLERLSLDIVTSDDERLSARRCQIALTGQLQGVKIDFE